MRSSIFEAFTTCLTKLSTNKLIKHFQPDIYKPEIDRYSLDLIKDVETIFTSSSSNVGCFLKMKNTSNYSDDKVMIEAVLSINQILLSFNFSKSEKVQFCKFQFEQFYTEFGSPKTLKPEIETLYKRLRLDIHSRVNYQTNNNSYKILKSDISNLIKNFEAKKVEGIALKKLAADIIHLHLNRLYMYNQRYLEMVTYYVAYRNLNVEIYKLKLCSNSAF
jgi:thiopeptide-type bacteriocin biosynthesis protein